MTVKHVNAIKDDAVGNTFDKIDLKLKQEGYCDIDISKSELGYEVTYYRQHGGIFTVMFDWEDVCQAIYYRY